MYSLFLLTQLLMKIQPLEQSEQLSAIVHTDSPVLIFKHSTRCSISRMAWDRLQRTWAFSEETLPVFYLDLLNFRELSNQVTEAFSVEHESPQALLVKNGRCVWFASHNGITTQAVQEALANAVH